MAEAGEPYNWTDVVGASDQRPQTRFLRGYSTQGIWFIWFEEGGIGIMRRTLGIRQSRDQRTGELTAGGLPGSHFGGDLCAASKAYLAGARSTG